jgi:hypothetical protein
MCRLVRVYLSSTYTDMTMEKTEIFNEICPQLKRFCMQDNFVLQILYTVEQIKKSLYAKV